MTTLRQAAQQALEALEWHYRQGNSNTLGGWRLKIDEKTLRDLKAALAEPVQEPTYCPTCGEEDGGTTCGMPDCGLRCGAESEPEPEPLQEPVAWVRGYELPLAPGDAFSWVETLVHKTPLYTAPPQRKPLTDELEAAFKEGWQSAKAAHGIKEQP